MLLMGETSRMDFFLAELRGLFPDCMQCRSTADLESGFHEADGLCASA